jgi:hypothetical protein
VPVRVNFNAAAYSRPTRSSMLTKAPGTYIAEASTSVSPAPRSGAVGTLLHAVDFLRLRAQLSKTRLMPQLTTESTGTHKL